MPSSSSDFRSLLTTFQTATTGEAKVSSSSSTTKRDIDKKKSSLKELTESMWRLTQIKRSTTAAAIEKKQATKENNNKTTQPQQPTTRLAICLCVVDDLPHEEVWKRWMQDSSSSTSAELFIHAKHPEQISSNWTRGKLLCISHKPNWNDVRIVKAMHSLMEQALKDKSVTHLVFGTESCIPICSLREIKLDPNCSYVKYFARDECARFDELHCWNPVQQFVPHDAIYKALPGWCVLCRNHAQAILDIGKDYLQNQYHLWQAFEHCWAPEEVYFPTALSLLGLLEDQTKNQALTYCEWDHNSRNHKDRAHPKEWDNEFNRELVHQLRKDGFLFMRKVKHKMPLHRWEQAVLGQSSSTEEQAISNRIQQQESDWKRTAPPHPAESSSSRREYHDRRDNKEPSRRYDYQYDQEESSRRGDNKRQRQHYYYGRDEESSSNKHYRSHSYHGQQHYGDAEAKYQSHGRRHHGPPRR